MSESKEQPKEVLDLIRQELNDLSRVLDDVEFKWKDKFPICAGTVLSMVGYKKLNPFDNDIDFFVKEKDISYLFKLIDILKQFDYKIRYSFYDNSNILYCVALTFKDNDRYGPDFTILHETKDYWWWKTSRDSLEITKQIKLEYYNNLVLDTLEGASFYRPENAIGYLNDVYGDWSIPKDDVHHWDPQNIPTATNIVPWHGRNVAWSL